MAYLKGGTFKMGDRGDKVTVAGFCLDQSEVTVAAYASCAAGGRCTKARATVDWAGITADSWKHASTYCNVERPDRQDHPVNCVDWNQAVAYCKAQDKVLPSEVQWEWAARGGPRATTYPWGSTEPGKQLCWAGEDSDLGKGKQQSTCAVGSYPSGDAPGKIHDLAGNVWEWTSSKYDNKSRVGRGGSWYFKGKLFFRAAFRFGFAPTDRNYLIGFRCAKPPL